MKTPFLDPSFHIRWDLLKAEHIVADTTRALESAEEAIQRIESQDTSTATFASSFMALDAVMQDLNEIWRKVGNLNETCDSPEVRKGYNEMNPKVSSFFAGLPLRDKLWTVLKAVSEQPETKALTGVEARFRDETLAEFREAGADLPQDKKTRLQQIEELLASKTQKFSENALDAANAFELVIDNEEELSGLPAMAREQARESALKKGYGTKEDPRWRFTLQMPSYRPVSLYANSEKLRKTMALAFADVGRKAPHDNRPIVPEILELRHERASLLGKESFADSVLARRMAGSGQRALEFTDDLAAKTRQAFEKEVRELEEFKAETLGHAVEHLEPWDFNYWSERLRMARYDFDAEALRPYFPMKGVIDGLFKLAEHLFGIRITEREERPPVWHEEVLFYDVHNEDGSHRGSFYTDWYPRESKRSGAWMDSFKTGKPTCEGGLTPHLGLIVGNLTPPSGDKPALLSHDDVLTIFHEFGHLIHHLLGDVKIPGLNGIHVTWDFVELPSQILENWCWEREGLDFFARHYETGETIPDDLLIKMRAARQFGEARMMFRQLSFGKMDLMLHHHWPEFAGRDVSEVVEEVTAEFRPPMKSQLPAFYTSFGHIFGDPVGYAAGYYSYKWAEVLDADAFTRFLKEGILNPETGRAFRQSVLSRGNSAPPAELFREFMGRDPDLQALLVRSGLAVA